MRFRYYLPYLKWKIVGDGFIWNFKGLSVYRFDFFCCHFVWSHWNLKRNETNQAKTVTKASEEFSHQFCFGPTQMMNLFIWICFPLRSVSIHISRYLQTDESLDHGPRSVLVSVCRLKGGTQSKCNFRIHHLSSRDHLFKVIYIHMQITVHRDQQKCVFLVIFTYQVANWTMRRLGPDICYPFSGYLLAPRG